MKKLLLLIVFFIPSHFLLGGDLNVLRDLPDNIFDIEEKQMIAEKVVFERTNDCKDFFQPAGYCETTQHFDGFIISRVVLDKIVINTCFEEIFGDKTLSDRTLLHELGHYRHRTRKPNISYNSTTERRENMANGFADIFYVGMGGL